jgi:hypothetical protein
VLDKKELENTTITKITSNERGDKRLLGLLGLREAIINTL